MLDRLSKFLDVLSEYLAARKGLLPLVGIVLIVANLVVKLILGESILSESDLFLHLGVIIAILGFMLARAL